MRSLRVITFNSSSIIIIGFLIVLIYILDTTAGETLALYIHDKNLLQIKFIYFIISILSLTFHILLLFLSTKIIFKIKKSNSRLSAIIKILYILSHIILIGLIIYLLIEQLITSAYYIILLQLILGLSFAGSVVILLSLTYTIIRSYYLTRNRVVLIYGLALVTLSSQLILAFFYSEISLLNKPEIITPDRNPWAAFFYNYLESNMLFLYQISENISFITVWVLTIFLLKRYISKIGKIKYFTILSIPAIYFLLQYSPLLLREIGTLSYLLMEEGSFFLYFYNFILNTVNVGTGVLLGISFFILSKYLNHYILKYYIILCATAIMIIFSFGISTSLTLAQFPAWSIISITFVLPASFLLLIGLDSATYYIASDYMIRKYLYHHKEDFELFQALGSKEVEEIYERKINDMLSKQLDNLDFDTMFRPKSEIDDLKDYINKISESTRNLRKSQKFEPNDSLDDDNTTREL